MSLTPATPSLRFRLPHLVLLGALAVPALSAVTPAIRINQIGFFPAGPKTAGVVGAPAGDFLILGPGASDTAFRGQLGAEVVWAPSEEKVRLADFSSVTAPGRYVMAVPGLGESAPFTIGDGSHVDLVRGSLKAYYYQRASMELEQKHAGKWARPPGHHDRRVAVHSSAATTARPAESYISSPRGWYDAGDYGKYIVNSGISTYTLLALYRHYPGLFDTLNLNIPESGDKVPDLLDEVLWNLRWMLTMQDIDGGVYHKLTTADFSGMVMPGNDQAIRYVVQKSTAATLDLAAVAAYASRVLRKFDAQLPGLADSALAVARKAWDWARANPAVYYRQATMNQAFTPRINTGEYGDGNVLDEFQWAGVELYLATKVDSFYRAAYPTALPARANVPTWPGVSALAIYSMAEELGNPDYPLLDSAAVRKLLRDAADLLVTKVNGNALRVPMAMTGDFNWGSNSGCGNMGMLLLQAYRATGNAGYLKPAVDALDYLMGRNGPSLSFVTGFGARSPRHPHHRPSEADANAEPVPGFVVGGPNATGKASDGCVYPSTLPGLSYSDTECSYASNEVAINWNAPLAYVSGALQALYGGSAGAISIHHGPGRAPRRTALLAWEADGPRLTLPPGVRGRLDLFDGMGRAFSAARLKDSALAVGQRPGLLFYRVRLEGSAEARTGSWATAAALRIPL